MKFIPTVMLVVAALFAQSAAAEMLVSSSVVKNGFFLAPDCKPTADPKAYNECVCQADIKKAQISGLSQSVNSAVNSELSLLPEKLAVESCEGTATKAPEGVKFNMATADYHVAYQTPTVLTVLITYSTYGVGSDHPLDGTEGFTFDLASGTLVDPIAYLKPDQLKKADQFIKEELKKKYPTALTDEAKKRTDSYLTENGCDTCTLFYGKDGWIVRFQIESIAPYMTGEPEVVLPDTLIAAPEKLITQPKTGVL